MICAEAPQDNAEIRDILSVLTAVPSDVVILNAAPRSSSVAKKETWRLGWHVRMMLSIRARRNTSWKDSSPRPKLHEGIAWHLRVASR
jgi:hypothetical protein